MSNFRLYYIYRCKTFLRMKCRHLFPKKMRMFIEDKRKGKASLRYNEQTILKQCKEVRRFSLRWH